MNFQEAYAQLKAGQYMQRAEWNTSGEYCILLPGMPYIWKILLIPNPSAGNWLPTCADFDANDWNVFERAVPAEVTAEAIDTVTVSEAA